MEALVNQLSPQQQQMLLEHLANKPSTTPSPVVASAAGAPVPAMSPANKKRNSLRDSYRDFSRIIPPPGYKEPTDIKQMNFAEKLHHILSRSDLESIIEWRPHGRAFKVYVPQLFALHVCPEYFGHKNYARFCNELKEDGFIKIPNGLDQNGKLTWRDNLKRCKGHQDSLMNVLFLSCSL